MFVFDTEQTGNHKTLYLHELLTHIGEKERKPHQSSKNSPEKFQSEINPCGKISRYLNYTMIAVDFNVS